MVDIGWLEVVGVRNTDKVQVDPATEGKLEEARALLESLDVKDYATETTLEAILEIFELGVIDVDTGLEQPTTPADTQPVSAETWPLPTGAATEAKQQTDALTDAELRSAPVRVRDTLRSHGTPTQETVTDPADTIVAAGTPGVFREVVVRVAPDADTGIYYNANGAATTGHFLLGPSEVRIFRTDQAISAIRAGDTDVTVYVEVLT